MTKKMTTTTTMKMTMMMTTNKSRIALVVLAMACALSLASTSLSAASPVGDNKLDTHQPYALICGTVFGPDRRPVRGVKVKIRRQGEKKAPELVSDGNGEF